MTKKEMFKMGFFEEQGKKNKFFLPITGSYETIDVFNDSTTTISSILEQIYENGRQVGIEEGRKEKSREIKRILDIKDEF